MVLNLTKVSKAVAHFKIRRLIIHYFKLLTYKILKYISSSPFFSVLASISLEARKLPESYEKCLRGRILNEEKIPTYTS